jgi:hypothetical protein
MKPISRAAAALLALFLLAGCGLTPQGDAIRQGIATQGREAAAAGLENAEWWQCRGSPVGAVVDRYGASEMLWGAWSNICLNRSTGVERPPVGPVLPPE